MSRLALVAACATAHAEGWQGRAAIGNDAFTSVIPPLDDQGFTNDLALAILHVDDLAVGGSIFHRMLTSRFTPERWDELDVRALAAHRWSPEIETTARLGPSFGGNFGGLAIQNTWHRWSGTGPTIEQGLQHIYPGDRRIGVVAGGNARAIAGDELAGYGVLDAQLALGSTGVTALDATAGVRAAHRFGGVALDAHVEIAVTNYAPQDPNLQLPGGYGLGWQLEWRAGLAIAWSRYRVSYQYRANEGGSGEPIGVIAFEWRTY